MNNKHIHESFVVARLFFFQNINTQKKKETKRKKDEECNR